MQKMTFSAFFCFMLMFAYQVSAQVIAGNYAIKNVQPGMLLRVKDAHSENGTPMVSYNPENWKCMNWDFKHVDGNTYQLQNLLTNKTFQTKGNARAGATFEEQPLNAGSVQQQYVFEPAGVDVYMIKLKGTDLYITADKSGEVNSPITLSAKTNTENQYWAIYQQAPTM
ncbi:RICIN domain-containing protein [Mucilaginibacter sp.]|uniref:RICIN domain-containing protein n=1 Tax=Mucilaginibacter sp. TaxID=1882438 RepID=UPI0025FF60E6|nr:RICIN domain-containing protein [Mucilaginibacter sp.]